MAYNEDRFVIINGVQVLKTRAFREGLIDDKGKLIKPAGSPAATSDPSGPASSRARTSESTRRKSGTTKATSSRRKSAPAKSAPAKATEAPAAATGAAGDASDADADDNGSGAE